MTRVGKIELRVPLDRQGRFRTEVFERYQRSEKALVTALMDIQPTAPRIEQIHNVLPAVAEDTEY